MKSASCFANSSVIHTDSKLSVLDLDDGYRWRSSSPETTRTRLVASTEYLSWLHGEYELPCRETDGMVSSDRSTVEPLFR